MSKRFDFNYVDGSLFIQFRDLVTYNTKDGIAVLGFMPINNLCKHDIDIATRQYNKMISDYGESLFEDELSSDPDFDYGDDYDDSPIPEEDFQPQSVLKSDIEFIPADFEDTQSVLDAELTEEEFEMELEEAAKELRFLGCQPVHKI